MKKKFVQTIRKASSGKQIVMFPFGGGSGYSYMELISELDDDIEVLAVNPPGHLMNGGVPVESIQEMLALYRPELLPFLKKDTIFFGHSIGGLVAFELIKSLPDFISVKHVVISCSNTPNSGFEEVNMNSRMDKQMLVDRCEVLGGLPQVFKDEADLLDLFIMGLRADLKALENYIARKIKPQPLDTSAVILYSEDDSILDIENIKEWETYIKCTEFVPFMGEHFYLFQPENRKKVAGLLNHYTSMASGDTQGKMYYNRN